MSGRLEGKSSVITGTAFEVGKAIAFLASDEALFITGVVLPVDGGIWRSRDEE